MKETYGGRLPVQGQNGKLRNEKRQSHNKQKGRVVSMRAWRVRKRIQYVRGSRSWPAYTFSLLNYVLLLVSGVFAVVGCIPTSWQIPSIIFTWFFATIGCAFSLLLHVRRDRFAQRALGLYLLCMALALVAALVKLHTLPG